jgi:hypothetical protein
MGGHHANVVLLLAIVKKARISTTIDLLYDMVLFA